MSRLMLALLPLFLVGVPWVLRHPARTILPLYAVSVPISNLVNLGIPLPPPFNTVSSLLGGLAIAACLGHIMLYRRSRVPSIPVALWLLFLAWVGLTSFWALDTELALNQLLIATPLIVLMVSVSLLSTTNLDLDVLRTAIIISGIIVGAYAITLVLSGQALPSYGVHERFFLASEGATTDPNILAASLLLPLALSVERILLGGDRWWGGRLVGIMGTSSVVVALFLTGSRGGLIACLATFLLTLLGAWRFPQARPYIRRTVGVVVAITLVGPAVLAMAQFLGLRNPPDLLASPPIQRLLDPTTGGSSGRGEIWTAGFLACRVHCAVGSGLQTFSAVFDERYAFSAAAKNLERGQAAHNLYLALAVEGGLIGLTLFFLALVAEWGSVRAPPVASGAPGLGAAMVGVLVANMFLSAVWFKYFWLVFAVNRVAEGALEHPIREPVGDPLTRAVTARAPAAG